MRVTIHEIHARYFDVDVEALAALGVDGNDDGELDEWLTHSDEWREDTIPDHCTEVLPSDGWRELYEIDREPTPKTGMETHDGD